MEPRPGHLNLGAVLSDSLRLFGRRAPTFVGIALAPAVITCALFAAVVSGIQTSLGGSSAAFDPRAAWDSMSALAKAIVIVTFLASQALAFLSFAAAVPVTSEWQQGRSLGVIGAYSRIPPWSILKLWLCVLGSLFVGPFAILIGPIVWLVFAPGFPVVVLEGLGVRAGLRRGWGLVRGNWDRLVLAYVVYLTLVIACAVAWISSMSILPSLSVLPRLACSALFLALLFLPSEWFFTVLTLAYLSLTAQEAAAMEGTLSQKLDAAHPLVSGYPPRSDTQ